MSSNFVRLRPALVAAGVLAACTTLVSMQSTFTAQPIDCLRTLRDASNPANCLPASSEPTFGALYPLGPDFNIDPAGRIGIGTVNPSANVTVTGTCLQPIAGTVTVGIGSTMVSGIGTSFTTDFATARTICIGEEIFTVVDVINDVALTLDSPHTTGETVATAYRDGTLFEIESAVEKKLVVVDASGKVVLRPTEATAIRAEFHHPDPFAPDTDGANIRLYNMDDTDGAFSGLSFHGPGFQTGSAILCVKEGGASPASTEHGLAFWTTDSGDSGGAERMRIDRDGDVGIGTTAPQGRLHLFGTPPRGAALVLESSTDPTSQAQIRKFTDDSLLIESSINDNVPRDMAFRVHGRASGEAMRITSARDVGIGTTSPSERLHVVGNICATGTIATCSDARFKDNVEPLSDALGAVSKLRGVRFDWKRDEFPENEFSDERQVGFLAHEVQEVLPTAVSEGSDGYLSVDYGRVVPLLVEAIKEQQEQIRDLREELAALGRGE